MPVLSKIYSIYLNHSTICTDTRKIEPGCIFFALKGENFNGNTFANDAIQKGAVLAVIDEQPENEDSRFILVPDVLTCLQDLAKHHRRQLSIPVIAITGSNGKTTTKELISRVLSEKYKTLYTSGNLNNHIGVPLTLLKLSGSHEIAVIEMGANHQKEIELLCSIALPDFVLITNVGKAHLEGFGGFEGVKKGKGEMFDYAKQNKSLVFLNNNNVDLKEMLGEYKNKYRYGTSDDCDIHTALISEQPHLKIEWKSKTDKIVNSIKTGLTGNYNFENVSAAIAIGNYFNVPAANINKAIESYIPDNQRSQEININNNHIILDAYNANPTSMIAALQNLRNNFKGKKAVLLGDMLELGSESEKEHHSILNLIAEMPVDYKLFVGPLFFKEKNNFNGTFCKSTEEAIAIVSKLNFEGYTILIKGSRGSRMDKLMAAFG